MNCDRSERLLMDSLTGALSARDRRSLDQHLASCQGCRVELAALESLWHELGDMDRAREQVPSDRLTRRFRLALANFESSPRQTPLHGRHGLKDWWFSLWSGHPTWQAAFTAAVLLLGVLLGTGLSSRQTTRGEIDALRAEIDDMSRAVTISLLRHQSASERLRAVSWSRMAGSDGQVLTALLDSARRDPNVNVRLAAVDALAAYADSGPVRNGLIETLADESSPLVQLAVLEAVAGREGLRNGELRKLTESGVVDESVLRHFAAQAERF